MENTFDPMGKWEKWHTVAPEPYPLGDITTYGAAAAFLDEPGTIVEDWGCGTGYARKFFHKARYIGIDGTANPFCDIVDRLNNRVSAPDSILMRHVLEHNLDWAQLLDNAVAQFKYKMVLVTFLNFVDATSISWDVEKIPCIAFKKADIVDRFNGIAFIEMRVGEETLFMLQKPCST